MHVIKRGRAWCRFRRQACALSRALPCAWQGMRCIMASSDVTWAARSTPHAACAPSACTPPARKRESTLIRTWRLKELVTARGTRWRAINAVCRCCQRPSQQSTGTNTARSNTPFPLQGAAAGRISLGNPASLATAIESTPAAADIVQTARVAAAAAARLPLLPSPSTCDSHRGLVLKCTCLC